MRNIDKIRQMTADELAGWFLRTVDDTPCEICGNCGRGCKIGIINWLEQEAEE